MISNLPALAPINMVMPQTAQLWMNILSWAFVAVMFGLALSYWRKRGSSIGIWFLLGGALTTFNEPVVDILGKCWFPAIGSWVFIKAWGISVPLHMLPVYIWYVGGQAFVSYRVYKHGVTRRGVFGLYAIYALVNVVLEVPGLNSPEPMYSYFGNQPLVLFKFPMWWTFVNALMPMVMGGIVFRCDLLLKGIRRLLIIPIAWMSASATNALIAAPIWVALNAEGSDLSLTHIAAFFSFFMGLMVCYGLSLAVANDVPKELIGREMTSAA